MLTQQWSRSNIIVNGNANTAGNITITLQGYRPLGIMQYEFSNSALSINSCYIMRANQQDILVYSLRNNTSAVVTGATATFPVLYMEDTE